MTQGTAVRLPQSETKAAADLCHLDIKLLQMEVAFAVVLS